MKAALIAVLMFATPAVANDQIRNMWANCKADGYPGLVQRVDGSYYIFAGEDGRTRQCSIKSTSVISCDDTDPMRIEFAPNDAILLDGEIFAHMSAEQSCD